MAFEIFRRNWTKFNNFIFVNIRNNSTFEYLTKIEMFRWNLKYLDKIGQYLTILNLIKLDVIRQINS